MDTWQLRDTTAYHEALHVVGAEFNGCPVANATNVPRGRTNGSIWMRPEDGSTRARLVCMHAPRQMLMRYEIDRAGCVSDYELSWGLARAATRSDAEAHALFGETQAEAYDFVRRSDVEFCAEWLARELLAQRTMTGREIGAAIAAARKAYQGPQTSWSMAPPSFGYRGEWTPSEEIHERNAVVARLSAEGTIAKARPRKAPKKPGTKSKSKAKGSAGRGMVVATETFTAILDGVPELVKAGISWVDPGHELALKYPGKFVDCDLADVANLVTE